MTVLDTIDRIIAETEEPDDALRNAVAALVAEGGCMWAGVLFAEGGELVLGPSAGTEDASRRTQVEIAYDGTPIAALAADGFTDSALLKEVAGRLTLLCLVGWDTGGEDWEP